MKLRFLGTGTSTGVPQIGCQCPACISTDLHDKRLRASVLIETGSKRLLVDCGPDFRQQIIDAGAPPLDALLVTHSHYDHVGGLDDLRPYCKGGRHFPVYCTPDVARDLRERNPWSFAEHPYPGVPTFAIHEISRDEPFEADGLTIVPLPVMHARLPIVGFRIGPLAYITDCKTMPDSTVDLLHGTDTLVLNALRPQPHMSHLSVEEALALIARIRPRRAYLTHISHDMGPVRDVRLPAGVSLAYDNQSIWIPTK